MKLELLMKQLVVKMTLMLVKGILYQMIKRMQISEHICTGSFYITQFY